MSAVLVLAAAGAILTYGVRLHDDGRCTAAERQVFLGSTGGAPAATIAPAVARVRSACVGSEALVSTAGALTFAGRTGTAARVAREATHRDPDSWAAWAAVAYATARSDPALAARARRRALALNPRYRFTATPPRRAPRA
jgi:hypothetical protein